MANFFGTGGNDFFPGTNAADLFTSGGGGDDFFLGAGGADVFDFGVDFNALDRIDGGNGNDVLRVNGNHLGGNAVFFAPTTIVNVETIRCAGGFGYDFKMDDANVAAGASLTVDDTAGAFGTGGLRLDGSSETDGSFSLLGGGDNDYLIGGANGDKVYGGGAADNLLGLGGIDIVKGGAGNDLITGGKAGDQIDSGAGADTLVYNPLSDSTSVNFDSITNFNFAGTDLFQLPVFVGGTNAVIPAGTLSLATFDGDLAAAVNAGTLFAGNAVLFTPSAGTFTGHLFMVVDANGAAGYQAGLDYVMELITPVNLGAFNFADFI